MKIQQQQKKIPTINQQVQVFFHRVYSLYLSLSPFLKPTFRCFLQPSLFYSALYRLYTHTHKRERAFRAENEAQTPLEKHLFATEKPRRSEHAYAYTLCFSPAALLATRLPKALPGVISTPLCRFGAPPTQKIKTKKKHLTTPDPPSPCLPGHPSPLPPPGAACQSVSVISDFHVRLGSNDHNNNGNNSYNNNLLSCVCVRTVSGWCSSSVQSRP